jgi:hypothetical protein
MDHVTVPPPTTPIVERLTAPANLSTTDVMRVLFARLAVVLAVGTAAVAGCRDLPTVACPDILYLKPTVPDTTTIKVGASTIAIAGATWGGCETGPPPPDFVWKASDSAVVAVTALDSIHARIQGLRPGRATVTPVYRNGRAAPPPAVVTVVP